MNRHLSRLAAGLILLVGAPACLAGTPVPVVIGTPAAKTSEFDKAVELAKKNDATLAIYYIPVSYDLALPNCPKCQAETAAKVGAVQAMAAAHCADSMVRVVIRHGETIPTALSSSEIKLKGTGVYFADSSLKLLGQASVDSKDKDELNRVGGGVAKAGDWKKEARRKIDSAIAKGSRGKLTDALKTLNEVAAQDAAIAAMVGDNWKTTDIKPSSESKSAGVFYPELVEKSTKEMTAKCQQLVENARRLTEAGKSREAIMAIAMLASDPADLPVVKDAKDLMGRLKPTEGAAAQK